MYPELTNPGDRQSYLRVEHDVPTEIVGGEDTFQERPSPLVVLDLPRRGGD